MCLTVDMEGGLFKSDLLKKWGRPPFFGAMTRFTCINGSLTSLLPPYSPVLVHQRVGWIPTSSWCGVDPEYSMSQWRFIFAYNIFHGRLDLPQGVIP